MTGFGWVVSRIGALRVTRNPNCSELLVIIWTVPVASPLPDVSRHIVEPISIRSELGNWGYSGIPISPCIFVGKMTLMRVGHPSPTGSELISPDKRFASQTAARGELPFRLSGEPLAGPFCIGQCVFISDLNDRIVALISNVALWGSFACRQDLRGQSGRAL